MPSLHRLDSQDYRAFQAAETKRKRADGGQPEHGPAKRAKRDEAGRAEPPPGSDGAVATVADGGRGVVAVHGGLPPQPQQQKQCDPSPTKEAKIDAFLAMRMQSTKKKSTTKANPAKDKKAKRKKKDPHAPKGPSGPYLFYQNEHRAAFLASYPELDTKAMTKKMGETWRSLGEEGQRPYRVRAEEDRARFRREMEGYQAGLAAEAAAVGGTKGADSEASTVPAGAKDAAGDVSTAPNTSQAVSFPFHASDLEAYAATVHPVQAKGSIVAKKGEEVAGTDLVAGKAKMPKDTPVRGDKENTVNDCILEKDDASVQDKTKKSGMFGGLGKGLAAAKRQGKALVKKAFRKRKHSRPIKASSTRTSSPKKASATDRPVANLAIANLEAMKESVSKLLHPEKKTQEAARAEDHDDLSTASSSSCDSIWEKGLHSARTKPVASPRKNDDKSGENDKHSEGSNAAGGAKAAAGRDDNEADSVVDDICAGGDWRPDEADDVENQRRTSDSNAAGATYDEAPKESRETSPPPDHNKAQRFAVCHEEETQKTENTAMNASPHDPKANSATTVSVTKLELVPMTKAACRAALNDKGVNPIEPDYLVTGSDEYNIARKTISLEMEWRKNANGSDDKGIPGPDKTKRAVLGRNKNTGIEWSAVSRKLCEVLLDIDQQASTSRPAAFLLLKKATQDHAIFLDGAELTQPVGTRIRLEDGAILSLYGPTGFAYRVELGDDSSDV